MTPTSRRGAGAAGPATPATRALDGAGVAWVGHPYRHDSAVTDYGREAADVLGVDPARVLKTLVVDTGAGLAVAVVPVDGRLDLKAVASVLGAKAVTMADPAVAQRVTGYVVGGISPLGQKRALPTVVDASAFGHATVLVSGGRRGFDVELSPDDLAGLTQAKRGDIGRR